jgi:hypothetical protein
MLARIRDWHQNLSWNIGYRHGKEDLPFSCPWWADREICALAYLQGKGADLTEATAWAKQNTADTQEMLESMRNLDIKPHDKA